MTNVANSAAFSQSRIISYWVTTVLVAFQLGAGGAGDSLRIPPVVAVMAALGYPAYFCVNVGIGKALGAVVVLAAPFPRLKEWAYAGTVFDLTGAAASHLAVGDDAVKLVAPIMFAFITFASGALRPSARLLVDTSLQTPVSLVCAGFFDEIVKKFSYQDRPGELKDYLASAQRGYQRRSRRPRDADAEAREVTRVSEAVVEANGSQGGMARRTF